MSENVGVFNSFAVEHGEGGVHSWVYREEEVEFRVLSM